MTNYILGIFAKRSKLVDKKDIKDIASNTIQIISLVLLLITDIFLDGKLSGLSLLVVIIFLSILYSFNLKSYQLFQMLQLLISKDQKILQRWKRAI